MTQLESLSAIFWDNDGVLVDTEKLYFRASREILAEAAIDLSWEHFQNISLRDGKSVFELASQAGFGKQECDRMRLVRNRRYAQLLGSESSVLPGVRETLERLHGKIPMAIVTSSLREHFDIIHDSSGLLGYFDFVLTREDYQRSKPHPEPYLSALQRIGIAARHALVIEDSYRGMRSAQQAGIPCIVVAPTDNPGDFPGAHAVVRGAGYIPSLLPFAC